MKSVFVQYRKKDDYPHQLALLLAVEGSCLKGPTAGWSDLLIMLERLGHLYYVSSRSYRARKFEVESCGGKGQKVFGW